MTVNVNPNMVRAMGLFGHPNRGVGSHLAQPPGPFAGQGHGIFVDAGSGDDEVNVGGNFTGEGGGNARESVAANEHGRIWNDPHFRGGDGGRFDIQGEAGNNYNLLSDDGVQFNGRFDAFGSEGTAVGKTGLTVTGENGATSEVAYNKDGTATIDGQAMNQGQQYTLADGGTAVLNGKKLSITTAEGYTIDQRASSWLGDGYINVDVHTGDEGVDHGQMPGGLLGHTFDADDVARNGKTGHGAQGEGAIDGVVGDYEVGELFTPRGNEGAGANGGVYVDGGSGDDKITINGPTNGPVHVDGGSGDDVITIGGGNGEGANGIMPGGCYQETGPIVIMPPHPTPQEPIAANEHGRVFGDPHFKGGDGGEYDVQGEVGKTYDLLSDTGLKLNGRFDAWGNAGATAVGETGMTVTGKDGSSSEINFTKDGTAAINGEQMEQGKLYQLADGGTAKLEGNNLTVTTAEGYSVKQQANGSHINLDVYTGDNGVGNGREPGGLLGQTFDADDAARNGRKGAGAQGEGAIDGVVQDYETEGLFASESSQDNSSGGPVVVEGGSGDDRIEINGRQNGPIHVDGGSGDDVIVINGSSAAPESDGDPAPDAPVAANETGKIWGDPHFVGGDGGKYDIQGEAGKNYDLLSDSGLDFRGRFDGWGDGVTVVGETGLTVGEGFNSDNVNFRKDGSAQINGQLMEEGRTYELADGGSAKLENGALTVTTAEGYTIKQTAHGSGDRAYINVEVTTGDEGVGNGKMPGGLLGQTFDADNEARNGKTGRGAQGEGAITGDVSDYERSALDPINDNRGSTDEPEGSDESFNQILDKIQELLEQFMEMLDKFMGNSGPSHSPSPLPETHTDAGSGDDEVNIHSAGNHHVDLGSGDDQAFVDFEGGGNSATIQGGSGDDTVKLAGSESDYTVTRSGDDTIYTDQDGNTIRVANDVEHVEFETAEAA